MTNVKSLAFIGCGGWAKKKSLPFLSTIDSVSLVAFAQIVHPEEIARLQQQFPGVHFYDTGDEMFRNEEIDGCFVSLPHSLIHNALLSAIAHKVAVMVDKPFTISFSQANEVLNKATEAGVTVGVCHQRRSYANIQEVKVMAGAGGLANMRWMTGRYTISSHPDWTYSWRNNPTLSGDERRQGILLDSGYHIIDSVLYLLNFELPELVYCSGSWRGCNVETDVTAVLDFSKERRVSVNISRQMPEIYEEESLTVLTDDCCYKSQIIKRYGIVEAISEANYHNGKREEHSFSIAENATYPIAAFVEHLTEGTPLPELWSARNSVVTMRVLDALYESLLTRNSVKL